MPEPTVRLLPMGSSPVLTALGLVQLAEALSGTGVHQTKEVFRENIEV